VELEIPVDCNSFAAADEMLMLEMERCCIIRNLEEEDVLMMLIVGVSGL
jgi:hypothetical protein